MKICNSDCINRECHHYWNDLASGVPRGDYSDLSLDCDEYVEPECSCDRCGWYGKSEDMVYIHVGKEPHGESIYNSYCPECEMEID